MRGTGVALVRGYRTELQGLRAVAVALVVVYHVWFGRVSGGVDVFFLVSGFLLTGRLVRAAARGPLELGRRWSRMLVRLLPCAVVVLVATVVAGALLLPEGRWLQTLREVIAAATFVPAFCPAVLGNVLVYLDDNHLTASYAASMADLVEGDVRAALGF